MGKVTISVENVAGFLILHIEDNGGKWSGQVEPMQAFKILRVAYSELFSTSPEDAQSTFANAFGWLKESV
jgi:hypothetical protein